MKTIDIKGTEYVPVNERIKEFWRIYPNGRITTEILSNEDGMVIIKASIYKDSLSNLQPSTTGIAYEREGNTFINKTSYIENCETSAIGRALGILGIGIDTSIASAEEIENAMENQKKIDAIKVNALERAITNNNISGDKVTEVLEKFGYKSISDISVGDYMKVVNCFKENK